MHACTSMSRIWMLGTLLAIVGCAEEPPPPAPIYEWKLEEIAFPAGVLDPGDINQGVAAVDFNNDGWIDLYTAGPELPGKLFINQGDGTFIAQEAPTTEGNIGADAADFDADGDMDLFISCGGGGKICGNGFFRNDGVDPTSGEVVFTDITAEAGLDDVLASSAGATWADINLDGHLDLFVPSRWMGKAIIPPDPSPSVFQDQLYRNNGDGTFTNITSSAGIGGNTNSQGACIFDYDGDGWPDIAVPTVHAPNLLWRNRGDETFESIPDPAFRSPGIGWGCVAEDFNHDGHIDVVFSSFHKPWLYYPALVDGLFGGMDLGVPKSGSALLLNQGDGTFADASVSSGLIDPSSDSFLMGTMGFQIGDLDLDGNFELFFGNGGPQDHDGEDNRLVSIRGTPEGTLATEDLSALINTPAAAGEDNAGELPAYPYRTHGTVFVDLDNDDDVDLFVGNGGHKLDHAEPNQLFRNDSPPIHNWLRIRLRGTTSNRDGVGSFIRISDGPRGSHTWQLHRRLSLTTGFNSTVPRELLLGVGLHEGPYHVTVTWPGGATQELTGVMPGQQLLIEEE